MKNLIYKNDLSEKELMMLEGEYDAQKRETWITWVLYLFIGGLGIHRFYLRDNGYATAMLLVTLFTAPFTLGIPTLIWLIVELFTIQKRIKVKNNEIEKSIIRNIKIMTNK